jgi:magnesium transporter
VVAGQGGNTGAQSLAVVLRGLALNEIEKGHAGPLIRREITAGMINGILVGIVTALAAWFWLGNPFLGVIIGAAMHLNMIMAACFGAFIPLTMKKLGLDPAQCSNIILTTFTDVVGFFVLLGFALLFQSYIV